MYDAAVSISHTHINNLYRFIFLSSVFVVPIAKIFRFFVTAKITIIFV